MAPISAYSPEFANAIKNQTKCEPILLSMILPKGKVRRQAGQKIRTGVNNASSKEAEKPAYKTIRTVIRKPTAAKDAINFHSFVME